jgi:hypothetical protein
MKWLKLLGFSILVLSYLPVAAFSQAHFWYLVDPGNDKWFYKPGTPDLFFHAYIPGTVINGAYARYFARVSYGNEEILACSLVSNNQEGDVFTHGSCDVPGEPSLLIDSPLWVGKSWQLSDTQTAEVIGEEDYTGVFGGPYHCFVIEYSHLGSDSRTRYWVSDGIGMVKLIYIEDGWADEIVIHDAVIPVLQSTWGGLKSQYR